MSAEFSAPVRRADERPQTTGPPSPPRSPRPLRNARQLHAAVAQETDAEGRDAVAELVEGDHAAGHRCGDRGQFEHPSTGSSQHPPFWPIAASSDTVTAGITRSPMPTRPGTATHPRSRLPRSRADQAAHPKSARRRPADDYLAGGIAGDVPRSAASLNFANLATRGSTTAGACDDIGPRPCFPREEQQEPCWC